ncbi:MAG: hypothetical protein U9Q80_04900 [Bacillota bacterium]|nr:hypothetical protein [Bacillota bacterium]
MKIKNENKWIMHVFFMTFFLAISISVLSEISIKNLNLVYSIIILMIIVFTGIIFDIIGIAVTAANPKPFNAMASRKIHGAKKAVKLVKKADRVSNFCNDVVGDIAGILSGAAIAGISFKMSQYDYSIFNISLIAVILSGLTASFTVGGKAFGKQIAIRKWEKIVFYAALVLYLIEDRVKIKVMK